MRNDALSSARRQTLLLSLWYVGIINSLHGVFEIIYDIQPAWPSYLGIVCGIIYILIGQFAVVSFKSNLIPKVLIITGIPFLVLRLWTLTGIDSASLVWFAIFPVYAILFKMGLVQAMASAIGSLIGFLFLTYFHAFHPFRNYEEYPKFLTILLAIYALGSVTVHMVLFARLKRVSDLQEDIGILKHQHEAKLADVGRLAGHIAHEINTPISSLYFLIDSMKSKIEAADLLGLKEDIQGQEVVLNNLTNTVRTLLRTTRKSSGEERRKINFDQIKSDLEVLLSYRLRFSGVDLKWEIDPYLTNKVLMPGTSEIIQVLIILINNSIDALSSCDQRQRWIKISARLQDNNLIIDLYDGGPGLPADVKKKIFEPDFTTKKEGQGSGFGLSVAKEVIQSLSGNIEFDFESEVTHFCIKIPLIDSEEESLLEAQNG